MHLKRCIPHWPWYTSNIGLIIDDRDLNVYISNIWLWIFIFCPGAYSGICPGGGAWTFFIFPGRGAQHPLGPKNPLKLIDFLGPWGGLSPYSSPLNTPLTLSLLESKYHYSSNTKQPFSFQQLEVFQEKPVILDQSQVKGNYCEKGTALFQ